MNNILVYTYSLDVVLYDACNFTFCKTQTLKKIYEIVFTREIKSQYTKIS